MPAYAPQAAHALDFYVAALRGLLAGLNAGKTQEQIASDLTGAGLAAPTGGPWNANVVKMTLKGLRAGRGRFFDAMLRATLNGDFTSAEVSPLLQRQRAPGMLPKLA